MTDAEDDQDLADLLAEVQNLRDDVKREGAALLEEWGASSLAPPLSGQVLNLAHYLGLRARDITDLQGRLTAVGLSSLGRCESSVAPSLDALLTTLRKLAGQKANPYPGLSVIRQGAASLAEHTDKIFGPRRPKAPYTRIIATLPPEAASSPELLETLIAAGVDCARINCAHDSVNEWAAMIGHIRAAEKKLGLSCRVLMDIAGPKCRVLQVDGEPKCRLNRGDRAIVARKLDPRRRDKTPRFTISFPEIIAQLPIGAEISLDDGKAAGRVIRSGEGEAEFEIFAAREKGVRLKTDKGVNFPTTELELPALTTKDFRDLDFIAAHADIVGYSFVQREADIELLQDHLAARRRNQPPQPILLKIETRLAVRNLPRLIVKSLVQHPTAVMIARGDLAVEIGFGRLSEMQEEILWLCEASRVPVVWATQVMDQFVRDGIASRSEMSDAAMAHGAEAVMLNKGLHLGEAVALISDVLKRSDRHHMKTAARYTQLHAWGRH